MADIRYYDFNPNADELPESTKIRASSEINEWVMVIGYGKDNELIKNCGSVSYAEQLLLLERVKKMIMESI